MADLVTLWADLAQRYGPQFTSRHGESWNGEDWLDEVGDLTDAQIDAGHEADRDRIGKLVREGKPTYPPSAGEFRALCLIHESNLPSHAPAPAKELAKRQPGDPRVARAWQAYMCVAGLDSGVEMDQQEIYDALDGFDMQEMHEQVRSHIRAANGTAWKSDALPALANRWPQHISSASGLGIVNINPAKGSGIPPAEGKVAKETPAIPPDDVEWRQTMAEREKAFRAGVEARNLIRKGA